MAGDLVGPYDSITPNPALESLMAWLELDASGNYHVSFRLGERRFKRSLKTNCKKDATNLIGRLEENLALVDRGRLAIPEGADIPRFLLSDGKLTAKVRPQARCTLAMLFDAYFAALAVGSIEQSTIQGMRIHERHLYRILGKNHPVQELTATVMQSYIEQRSGENGIRGRKVTATTIKKAIVTLRTAWNWGVSVGRVTGPFPSGLKYPKASEKPRFQTWEEIERQIRRRGLTAADEADLWDCLFLTLPEIADLLEYVRQHSRQPFIYPMFAFAAHTGARRSELVRAKLADLDLENGAVTIQERKRCHSRTTTRRIPISPFLSQVLTAWLDNHPGGSFLFCQEPVVRRSKKDRPDGSAITRDEAHDHFKRTLGDSKWQKLRGWHCLRHSFASNCAAKGIDQRIINTWMGHQTEEMVRRYRHLIPNQEQQAICSVFS